MPKQTPAAEQFAALGIAEADYTKAMTLAVKQRWSNLPVERKVADLRAELAAVEAPVVPTVDALRTALEAAGEPLAQAAAEAEHARLKRNAAVTAWRAKNKLQAAIDARDIKFAALRAKRGKVAPVRPGTETGDSAPVDSTSSGDRDQLAAHSIQTAARVAS